MTRDKWPMTCNQLEKIMAGLPDQCRVCVFVPGIGNLEIVGVTSTGQITQITVSAPPAPQRYSQELMSDADSEEGSSGYVSMEPDPDGEWVKFAEVRMPWPYWRVGGPELPMPSAWVSDYLARQQVAPEDAAHLRALGEMADREARLAILGTQDPQLRITAAEIALQRQLDESTGVTTPQRCFRGALGKATCGDLGHSRDGTCPACGNVMLTVR